jgi:hypothetical protein
MNGKGGMNNKEFERYIDNCIVPLFPDLEDMPGKWILHKVDSGCGCNWWDLLNKCRFRGAYIDPGLPSSTSMQQETDINFYGPFKGVVWRNLAKIAITCYAKGITMSLGTSTFRLIVYGGVWPDSGVMLENAWSEVGAILFSRKCLMNKKIHHDVTDKDSPDFDVFQDIQSQNNFSTTLKYALVGERIESWKVY